MKLTIGNVTLENNLILAPMAGVTDLPFRLLCKEQGAGLLCTEMISAKAIHFKNKNTKSLMRILPEERPVSLQLFGSEPDLMAEIAAQIEDEPFDILDINMGCPVWSYPFSENKSSAAKRILSFVFIFSISFLQSSYS